MSAAQMSWFGKKVPNSKCFEDDKEYVCVPMKTRSRQVNHGLSAGGVALATALMKSIDLAGFIDSKLKLNKTKAGYRVSTHVMNMALNTFCGGKTLDEIDLRRDSDAYRTIFPDRDVPASTTEGDFCRRLNASHIDALQDAFNDARAVVWRKAEMSGEAWIDGDGVFVETLGECKEGADFTYKKGYGYHVLNISLSNTGEPLFLVNRPGNRPSHEGAADRFSAAAELCLRGGFTSILFRGDTDFSQSKHLDSWDEKGYKFIFGFDAHKILVAEAERVPVDAWKVLSRTTNGERDEETFEVYTDEERERRHNHKIDTIKAKGYRNLELIEERVAEFMYQPNLCERPYRMVVVKKRILVTKGYEPLLEESKFFFYITNDLERSAFEIVKLANQRCNQENIHAVLKEMGVLRAPCGDLNSNWAYMVITALAWSLKTWIALKMPDSVSHDSRVFSGLRRRVMTMEFRTFVNLLINIPVIVKKIGKKVMLDFASSSIWRSIIHQTLRKME